MSELHARVAARADSGPVVIEQHDIFYNVSAGRLKLRVLAADRGELIYYNRPDHAGPKLSNYQIVTTTEPERLAEVMRALLGVRGEVRKRRTLFLIGQTRVHLDEVEQLGAFMELEVVLQPDEDVASGEQIARLLMEALGIPESQLVTSAYIDLMAGAHAPWRG